MRQLEDAVYRWTGHYDGIEPRRNGRPRPPADGLSLRFGPTDDGLDPPGPMFVASAANDGHELFLGYMSEWLFHCTRKDARRLAWWILLRWWAAGEWFGLRRAVWYWALFRRVDRTRIAGRG
jgi:hypothetical protein